jgi:hypothetical protein
MGFDTLLNGYEKTFKLQPGGMTSEAEATV